MLFCAVAVMGLLSLVLIGCDGDKKQESGGQKQSGSSFTDLRDGKKYRIVKIGDNTWMAENLNYKIDDSWCYDNDESNCKKYGRLYNWGAAMEACPTGWRLPTYEEWDDLIQIAGNDVAGVKLKSKTDLDNNNRGSDELDFSALPGGRRDGNNHSFTNVGTEAIWWGYEDRYCSDGYVQGYDADERCQVSDGDFADYVFIGGSNNTHIGSTIVGGVGKSRYGVKDHGFSVRCVPITAKEKLAEALRVFMSFESAFLAAVEEGGNPTQITENDLIFQCPVTTDFFTYKFKADGTYTATSIIKLGDVEAGAILTTRYNGKDGFIRVAIPELIKMMPHYQSNLFTSGT